MYATLCTEAAEKGQPKPPLSVGFCYELCAGLVDKNKSLEEIAREEVICEQKTTCDLVKSYIIPKEKFTVMFRTWCLKVESGNILLPNTLLSYGGWILQFSA